MAAVINDCRITFRFFFAMKILFIMVNAVSSQKIGFGGCPEVTPMEYFSLGLYIGEWYEYARYASIFELSTSCVKADYAYDEFGDNSINGVKFPVYVKNSGKKDTILVKGKDISMEGRARLENPNSQEAKLRVNFNGKDSQYWIIDTDYINYSMVWSCKSYLGFFHLEYFWIMTPFRNPPKSTIDEVYERMNDKSYLKRTSLTITNQDNCYN